MKSNKAARFILFITGAALATLGGSNAMALKVGDTVRAIKVKDADNNSAKMPDIGKKVLVIFYTDPDVKDLNEPFRNMLKAAKLDEKVYRGYGVANLKDTWKPNFIIRKIIRNKIKKFNSTILTDTDRVLRAKWRLGECNDKDVVIVVGTDKKVKYLKKDKMSSAEQKKTLALVRRLIAEAKSK